MATSEGTTDSSGGGTSVVLVVYCSIRMKQHPVDSFRSALGWVCIAPRMAMFNDNHSSVEQQRSYYAQIIVSIPFNVGDVWVILLTNHAHSFSAPPMMPAT